MNEVKTVRKRRKLAKPIIVDEVSSEKVVIPAYFEKKQIKGGVPIPEGHVRVIVLKDCGGMSGDYFKGDIIDLPERRFKSMRFRGLVDEYKGEAIPNRRR